jgi:hypothetical protein
MEKGEDHSVNFIYKEKLCGSLSFPGGVRSEKLCVTYKQIYKNYVIFRINCLIL